MEQGHNSHHHISPLFAASPASVFQDVGLPSFVSPLAASLITPSWPININSTNGALRFPSNLAQYGVGHENNHPFITVYHKTHSTVQPPPPGSLNSQLLRLPRMSRNIIHQPQWSLQASQPPLQPRRPRICPITCVHEPKYTQNINMENNVIRETTGYGPPTTMCGSNGKQKRTSTP